MKKINYVLLFVAGLFIFMNNGYAAMEACNKYLDITIDEKIANAVRIIILIIQIVVPVLLIIFGSIDFLKAVVAQKEDEIKKGQQTFIKRVIAALLMFFIIAFVKLGISFGAGKKSTNILNCVSCFTEGATSTDCVKQPIDETKISDVEDNVSECRYYEFIYTNNNEEKTYCVYTKLESDAKAVAYNHAKKEVDNTNNYTYSIVDSCANPINACM